MITDSLNSSLLVPLQQVSKSVDEEEYLSPNTPGTHQYITIRCMCCAHTMDVPVYCGNRFCPVCSRRRLSRVRRRLEWIIKNVRLYRAYGFKHLTLTIPNQTDLPTMVKQLIKSFRRMRQRAYWKNHVKGGAFVIEITGRPGNWHAHIHAIIEARYMDWSRIHKLWSLCSGGEGTHISRIPAGKVIGYLTKYLSKPDVPDQVSIEISDSLKGTRLFSPFGAWYALNSSYIDSKPSCPECKQSDLMLNDYVIYGHYRGSFTKYGGQP